MPTVSVTDGSLHYEQRGSGPPLVLIHGGWQDSASWKRQIEYFADDYRVITYDIRGHGRTGATGATEYSIDLFADDLETLLSVLEVEQPILAGMSVGGMITRAFLARHPESVRGAVIGGPFQSMMGTDFATDLNPFFSPVQGVSQMVSTLGSAATFRTLVNSMQATNGGSWLSLDSDVRAQAITAAGAVPKAEYTKIFRALYEHEPVSLSHVETPLLVLYGDHEAPSIKRQGRQLAEQTPHGQRLEISDAAHLVNQDNPEAFNEACSEFITTIN
ncbi:alpha/beta fold hydrolase [Halovenus sp. HT40]|uniref:alpha/beta fold hydrolase n=1 Tax=Halovenus sp. HT40 TaxID=3126691 RepID=UPI00300F565B